MLTPILLIVLLFHLLSTSAISLNATSSLSLNTTSPLHDLPVTCLNRQPALTPPPMADCQAALTLLFLEPNFNAARRWARPDPESFIVKKWSSRQCSIALIAKTVAARDLMKPVLIADAATQVILRCVRGHDMVGGKVTVGRREVFEVGVANVFALGEGQGGVLEERGGEEIA